MSCNHDCKNCKVKSGCSEKKYFQTTNSNIKKIIAIMSGKGGVGKSSVTCMLASLMNKRGYKVGILDADITGPSIPKAFGVKGRLLGDGKVMYPHESEDGIKIVSINLLLEDETSPVLWRGPVLSNALNQFYSEVAWEELDYLFIDMPPGTSDIQITVLNNIPVDGVVMVSTPQDLVSMVVAKACKLVDKVNVKTLGLVENMAYVTCPCCDKIIEIYGPSKLESAASDLGIKPLASLPIDPSLASLMDEGKISEYFTNLLDLAMLEIESL